MDLPWLCQFCNKNISCRKAWVSTSQCVDKTHNVIKEKHRKIGTTGYSALPVEVLKGWFLLSRPEFSISFSYGNNFYLCEY